MEKLHRPVLLQEVLENLRVRQGGTYADLTFGEGGHTGAMLEAGAALVVATDRDPEALGLYREGESTARIPGSSSTTRTSPNSWRWPGSAASTASWSISA